MNATTQAEREARLRKMYDKNLERHEILSRTIVNDSMASFVVGRPGECAYRSEVMVLSWGHLLVHGDVNTVIFGRCSYRKWWQVLRWMSGHNYGYAEEKASIGSGCREMASEFDEDVALGDLLRWRREKMINKETAREAHGALFDGNYHEAQRIIAHEDFELVLGTCVASRVIMALAVVTKLCQLLDDEATATHRWTTTDGQHSEMCADCGVDLQDDEASVACKGANVGAS